MKTVYLYSNTGAYVGPYICQESPLEPGIYITPTDSTEIEPPEFTELESCAWNGAEWLVATIPVIAAPKTTVAELMAQLADIQAQITALKIL